MVVTLAQNRVSVPNHHGHPVVQCNLDQATHPQFTDNVDNPKSLANQMGVANPQGQGRQQVPLGNAQRLLLPAFKRFRQIGAATAAASAWGAGWLRVR